MIAPAAFARPLAPASIATVRRRLAQRVGIACDDERRLRDVMARHNVDGLLDCPVTDARWDAFVEDLLVHETYFFRHPQQLAAIEDVVLPDLRDRAAASARSTLDIWSASCSTGEEVWTLALIAGHVLRGSGVGFVLHGSDISAKVVATARRAIYQRSARLGSFRAVAEPASRRFACEPKQGVWSAPAELRAATRFFRHNLLEPPAIGPLDLVVCRNTLIYMGEDARRLAVGAFATILRPGGYLALGPAETTGKDLRFVLVERGNALIYRRTDSEPAP